MQRLLSSQNISEQQASAHAMTRNRLTSGMLYNLLNERKSLASKDELLKLAQKYDIDVDVLERVATYANIPSVLKGSERKVVEDDGQERVTYIVSDVSAIIIYTISMKKSRPPGKMLSLLRRENDMKLEDCRHSGCPEITLKTIDTRLTR